jgi:hypothetical protein
VLELISHGDVMLANVRPSLIASLWLDYATLAKSWSGYDLFALAGGESLRR